MTSVTYQQVEEWCQEAISILGSAGVSPKIVDMQRDVVRQHAGTRMLHKIAADLAEGLSELPFDARKKANDNLLQKYGFGYDLFTEAKLKRALAVLTRGKVKSDHEYRQLMSLASDTTVNPELRVAIDSLLGKYEADRGK